MPNVHSNRNLFLLYFGNMIEGYGFALFLYFADQISQYFFGYFSAYAAKQLTYAVFLVGFLSRPLGGIIIGWLSDRHCPHTILHYSIVLMGMATMLIALIPSAQLISWLAPICLVVLRLLQGISAGGQYPGLISMTVKQQSKPCTLLGIMLGVSTLGALLAALTSWASQFMTLIDPDSCWTWRAAFLSSSLLLVTYLTLSKLWDTGHQAMQATPQSTAPSSISSAIRTQFIGIVAVTLMTIMGGSLYYLLMGYFVDYEIHQLHLSINHARLVTSITLLGAAFAYPIAGMLADRLSHQRIFMFAAASMLVFVTPTIGLMQHHATMVTITASTLFLIALSALMQATISPLFAQVFHPEWRTTCCAISYNLGNGCSGATPMFALMMITNMPKIGLELVFLILVSLGSLGYLLAQLELKKKVTLSA